MAQAAATSTAIYISSAYGYTNLTAGRLENVPNVAVPTSSLASQTPAISAAVLATSTSLSSSTPLPSVVHQTVGPFSPTTAILGGIPTTSLDVPITVFFLILFLTGAVTHFSLHEYNSKRGHKFHISDMVFDFCMVRTVTCTMRIVWAFRPANNSVIVAALIFENAGVVVLFAVNIIFSQRIIRAIHPKFGWHPVTSKLVFGLLGSVVFIVLWNITSLTLSFFTLNPKTEAIAHGLLLFGSSYTLFLGSLPIIVVGIGATIPSPTPVEKFGIGRFRTKIVMLLFASTILSVGAIVRLLGNFQVHPIDKPGKIDSKEVFYTTGFMLEIIVVAIYAVFRIDLRFWVPDGSTGPGDYSKKESDEEELFGEIDIKATIRETMSQEKWEMMDAKKSRVSRDQVAQAIEGLQLDSVMMGNPIDNGSTELLLYAFRVQKTEDNLPRKPPRSSSWMRLPRPGQ